MIQKLKKLDLDISALCLDTGRMRDSIESLDLKIQHIGRIVDQIKESYQFELKLTRGELAEEVVDIYYECQWILRRLISIRDLIKEVERHENNKSKSL